MIDWDIIVSAVGIIQAIIFILLMLMKKKRTFPDKILLCWFITFCLHLGLILLIDTKSSAILAFAKTLVLLHGPFFLIYTQSVFGQFIRSLYVHFITFTTFLSLSFLVSESSSAQMLEVVLSVVKLATLIGYPIYILVWIRLNIQDLKNKRADSFLLDINWIRSLAYLMVIYACIGIGHILSELLLDIAFSSVLDLSVYAMMITVIGFLGLKFGKLYAPEAPGSESNKPYKNSPLKHAEMKAIKTRVESFFASSTDYLRPDFKLAQLSDQLDVPKHHLSEVINLEMATSFYDMVNAKRIQYAIDRMQSESDTHLTLEGLGYECGFNTKSAFYHHFKNLTGKTPGQYKSQICPD